MSFDVKRVELLSHFLNEKTPGYGGSSGVKIKHASKIADGASSNSQEWTISNHIGTHIDLPAHFDNEGMRLNQFNASSWIFSSPFLLKLHSHPGQIFEVNTEFQSIPMEADILLIKTDFQKFRHEEQYWKNNPGFSPDLALWLRRERPNLRCVGFDFISITSYSNRPLGREAHRAFLGKYGETNPIIVIEDMNLQFLESSPGEVIVAPLLIDQADGSPVTVLAKV